MAAIVCDLLSGSAPVREQIFTITPLRGIFRLDTRSAGHSPQRARCRKTISDPPLGLPLLSKLLHLCVQGTASWRRLNCGSQPLPFVANGFGQGRSITFLAGSGSPDLPCQRRSPLIHGNPLTPASFCLRFLFAVLGLRCLYCPCLGALYFSGRDYSPTPLMAAPVFGAILLPTGSRKAPQLGDISGPCSRAAQAGPVGIRAPTRSTLNPEPL